MMDFLAHNSGVIGLLIFVGIFVSVLIRLFWPGAKPVYDRFAHIPFMENDHGE